MLTLSCNRYDLYSIAFQELVPLNAQQILQTDPAARSACTSPRPEQGAVLTRVPFLQAQMRSDSVRSV